MKTILVTGSSGFIGSHIVEQLLASDKYCVKEMDKKNGLSQDFSNYESCLNFCKGVDIICHQGGYVSVPNSFDNILQNNSDNISGTLNLLKAAVECGVKRFVFASSSCVSEELKSPYAITKDAIEKYSRLFFEHYGLETIGLRYYNVYGRFDGDSVIPSFIKHVVKGESPTIYGSGDSTRDFIHIDDIVQANFKAMFTDNKKCFGEIFDIGSGDSIRINDLFDMISIIFGNGNIFPEYAEKRAGDISESYSELQMTRDLLGFGAKWSLIDGLRNMKEYGEI